LNAEQFKEAYAKLQLLDERLSHKVRPRGGLTRPSVDQLEERLRELAQFTLDLKDVLDELFRAIAAPAGPGAGSGTGD
jgi:hypothetical protein